MTTNTLRKKVIDFVNHADGEVLEAMYKLLKLYEAAEGKSAMTDEQKSLVEERSAKYKQGKLKTGSWQDVKKRARKP